LLVLFVILGIASFASANLAPTTPMTIGHNTGNTLFTIDLLNGLAGNTTALPVTGDGSGTYWVLIGVNGGALAATLPPVMGLSAVYGDASGSGMEQFATPGQGIIGEFRTSTMGSYVAAGGTYADSFTLIEGVTTLYLYAVDDGVAVATLVDTYVIPEPATIALLCLGGLLIRKK
jgi:hypothetical protein